MSFLLSTEFNYSYLHEYRCLNNYVLKQGPLTSDYTVEECDCPCHSKCDVTVGPQ